MTFPPSCPPEKVFMTGLEDSFPPAAQQFPVFDFVLLTDMELLLSDPATSFPTRFARGSSPPSARLIARD